MDKISMKTLTVITTTYNRAYCLHQLYESLCRQSCRDFLWMIIDDGSTDNTKNLIEFWKDEGRVEIEYYYKDNGGMHTARNMAYNKVQTEINVIIDSDDWMTDDAVQKIVEFWNFTKNDRLYGIVANNVTKDGELIGSCLPSNVQFCTLTSLEDKYHVKGDKKLILRSELSKLYPFPEFPGEKFYPASYKYKFLDLDYKLALMDAPVCVVDYNTDSMTYNKFSQYKTCCRGFAHFRNEMIRINKNPVNNIKHSVHYIAESIFAGEKHYIRNSSKPFYIVMMLPFGLLYYRYLSLTSKKY